MVKKIFYWVFTILQIFLLISAYAIQYFSMKKMGMMRYVLYVNHELEIQYPISTLKYAVIAFLTVLSIIVIISYIIIKKGNHTIHKKALLTLLAGAIITLAFIFFTLAYSTESYRSYYFISLILAIVALIQDVKILVFLKKDKMNI